MSWPDDQEWEQITTAALFHSNLLGKAGEPHYYRQQWLPRRQEEFPKEAIIPIEERHLLSNGGRQPDLAIALANPDDPLSWNPAIEQCQLAKRVGALTLLLAAFPEPLYRQSFDQRLLKKNIKVSSPFPPDVIIRCVTADAYCELANIVFGLTHYQSILHMVDFGDLCMALKDADDAILLRGCGHGTDRLRLAAYDACKPIINQHALVERVKAGVILIEVNENIRRVDDIHRVYEVFSRFIPKATLILAFIGRRHIKQFVNISAILTLDLPIP